MTPFVQKLPLQEATSFVARTYRSPHFEVGWHQHPELELILFTEGSGTGFIGNHIGEFSAGDIYFLGAGLPHTFQKRSPDLVTSAIVVQFTPDFWGEPFLQLPECRSLRQLFRRANQGIKLSSAGAGILSPLIRRLETAMGFERLLLLADCLHRLSLETDCIRLGTIGTPDLSNPDQDMINRVFRFTYERFKEPLSLKDAAAVACLSIPSFCIYFKRRTQKTYMRFLNEVRIGHACERLTGSGDSVLQICYNSGFSTLANFHQQFLRMKGCTPLRYRKRFEGKG